MTDSRKKPDYITQEDWDAVDVPEASDEEFARAVPFAQLFPYAAQSLKRQGGRPNSSAPKSRLHGVWPRMLSMQ